MVGSSCDLCHRCHFLVHGFWGDDGEDEELLALVYALGLLLGATCLC